MFNFFDNEWNPFCLFFVYVCLIVILCLVDLNINKLNWTELNWIELLTEVSFEVDSLSPWHSFSAPDTPFQGAMDAKRLVGPAEGIYTCIATPTPIPITPILLTEVSFEVHSLSPWHPFSAPDAPLRGAMDAKRLVGPAEGV